MTSAPDQLHEASSNRRRRSPTVTMPYRRHLTTWILLISCFPGWALTGEVTLKSITIYKTHELVGAKPRVYFKCKGENRIDLPDVKKTNVFYAFKGQESWQPLTELNGTKCKRCGFYEKDSFKSDDVFEEWELCPSDFSESDGEYERVTEKEFSATFECLECVRPSEDAKAHSPSHNREKRMHVAVAIIISVLISTVLILGLFAAYKYWQKRKRQQDQARFLQLFEEGDDIEDELGLAL